MSEDFTNDASGVDAHLGPPGTPVSMTTPLTVHFDAATQSYTLTMASRPTRTFTPADIQPGSDPNVTIYQQNDTSGPVAATERLVLTKNGPLTYTYVGGGVWTRYEPLARLQHDYVTAFAYGVETPDAALPRTGSANFDVTLAGVFIDPHPIGYGPEAGNDINHFEIVSGQGVLSANFASGQVSVNGLARYLNPYDGTIVGDGLTVSFSGNALIASARNSFAGNFAFDNHAVGPLLGNWMGRFYGPTAQEVGASFFAENFQPGAPDSPYTMTGVILGRRSAGSTSASYSDFGSWVTGAGVPADVSAAVGRSAGTGIPVSSARSAVPAEARDAVRAARQTRESRR